MNTILKRIKLAWADMPPQPANVYQMEAPSQQSVQLSNGSKVDFGEEQEMKIYVVSFTVPKQSKPATDRVANVMCQRLVGKPTVRKNVDYIYEVNGSDVKARLQSVLSKDEIEEILSHGGQNIEVIEQN